MKGVIYIKIALGTVQFGMNYGITNASGMTPMDEVKQILEFAAKKGINMLDTAPSYGESEKMLGKNRLTNFNLVTKTPHIRSEVIRKEDVNYVENVFYQSLINLNVNSVYGLIIHQTSDMYKNGFEILYKKLMKLKEQGLIKKIGISVYEQSEIDYFLSNYTFDLVQLPINIFDQRIANTDTLSILKEKGTEIHARSVFLQGVLLTKPNLLPSRFHEIQPIYNRYCKDLQANGLSLLEGALYFIKSKKEIDYAVIGVNNLKQIQEIYHAYLNVACYEKIGIDFSKYAMSNERIIDPRKW